MTTPHVTSYSKARATLAALCDEVASTREPVLIRRRGKADVALVSADELASLAETAHLLRSPANARRLLTALLRAQKRELPPSSVEKLRREMGLGKTKVR
jgi:antitoxin YefM